jgi:hemolysin activation/secretion protein
MSKSKAFVRLVDSQTGECVAAAELTPAAVKRLTKLYAQFGYYVEAVA